MDIPLLKYLDILIGLSVAMLIVSTVVMALVQVLLTSSYARARYLAEGLGELLGQLDPVVFGGASGVSGAEDFAAPDDWAGEYLVWGVYRLGQKSLAAK